MQKPAITREAPARGVFQENCSTDEGFLIPAAPIRDYCAYLDPRQDAAALKEGERIAAEIKANHVADFERTEAYCAKHGETNPDQMVHVSTFLRLEGMIYMTYYANTSTDKEDPNYQEARLAMCPEGAPEEMEIVAVQRAGDTLDGRTIDRVYDTILLYKGGDELYLLWTASADGLYYRLYCVYDRAKRTLSAIRPNRFKVGEVTNDFSTTGITTALAANGLGHKGMFSDIGIMQKLTRRVENGETWYYTGAYSGYFNCIIKSRDFITWQFVAMPDFINLSLWENATYVIGDRCWYFVRQDECSQGFLTCYDLEKKTWAAPMLIRDAQSRSDFILDDGRLLLIHAPVDRNGIGIVEVNQENFAESRSLAVVNMQDSMFYPFVDLYDGEAFISYTVNRKHIRLSHFRLP